MVSTYFGLLKKQVDHAGLCAARQPGRVAEYPTRARAMFAAKARTFP
jgi:hypothetical protein